MNMLQRHILVFVNDMIDIPKEETVDLDPVRRIIGHDIHSALVTSASYIASEILRHSNVSPGDCEERPFESACVV